jgi:hypothetical protein
MVRRGSELRATSADAPVIEPDEMAAEFLAADTDPGRPTFNTQ